MAVPFNQESIGYTEPRVLICQLRYPRVVFKKPRNGTAYRVWLHKWLVICKVGRHENAIGWYHSHPGYGCWLSGIDVSTQMLNQSFQVT